MSKPKPKTPHRNVTMATAPRVPAGEAIDAQARGIWSTLANMQEALNELGNNIISLRARMDSVLLPPTNEPARAVKADGDAQGPALAPLDETLRDKLRQIHVLNDFVQDAAHRLDL
jgi:hypothetical protein